MEYLQNKIIEHYGLDVAKEVTDAFLTSKPLTLRVNTSKTNLESILKILRENNISHEKVEWYDDALIIRTKSDIRELDIYKNGEIYVQNLSSMLPPIILNPKENETILDMAAAPGGKTLQIYNLSGGKALITACERNKIRLEKLKYNIEKQGGQRIVIINKDARELDEYFKFDKILLDAPCTGSGTISSVDNHEVTENLLNKTTRLQKDMLEKAYKLLKPGGEIVYSTCSILKEENENIVKPYIERNLLQVVPIEETHFTNLPKLNTKIEGSMCIKPNALFEGFYVIKLKKLN